MFPAPYPYLLLLVPAAVLARDDFRTRRVDASWLAVLGTVSVGVSWHTLGWRTMLLQTAGNAALLLLSGTALFGYLRLRRLAVRHSVGFGDALFLLAVAPLFAPTEFLWFLIAACVVGDGEAQEGEIWEAANTAHKYGLDNLIVFVDYNNLQLDGTCDEIMPNGDLGEKFKAFGWETLELDGHSMEEIVACIDKC